MRSTILVSMTCLLGGAAIADAQEPAPGDRAAEIDVTVISERVRPGDEIRFRVAGSAEPLSGWLARISTDSLVIRTEGRLFLSWPIAELDDFEVKRRGGATAGLVAGGLVGVGVGVGIILSYEEENCSEQWFPDLCEANKVTTYLSPLIFGVAGGLLGRLVGRLVAPDHWERVPLRELSVRPTANGGPGLTLMITLSGSRGSR